jgi:hypothetical protein
MLFVPATGTDAAPQVTGYPYKIALLPTGVTVRDLAAFHEGLGGVRAQFVEASDANFMLNDPLSASL